MSTRSSPPQERAIYTIGALSKRSGVPVRTIRFYSDEGVLPPSEVSDSGYRRYSATDLARLETIRTLRAAGFDLDTIRGLLSGEIDARRAVELQIRALEVQERLVRRQRKVLERALEEGGLDGYPDRARSLALLSAAERSSFLRRHLEESLAGIPVDRTWLDGFLDAAVADLPDDLSDDQLAAWAELAEMVADPSFAEAMRRNAEPFWSRVQEGGAFDDEAYRREIATITGRAKAAVRARKRPDAAEAREVADAWVTLTAGAMGKVADDDFMRWMAEHARQHDPRLARYWELVGRLKGWQIDRELSAAWEWLAAALESRLAEGAG